MLFSAGDQVAAKPQCFQWDAAVRAMQELVPVHVLTEYVKPAGRQGELKKPQIRNNNNKSLVFFKLVWGFCVEGGVDLGDFARCSTERGQGASRSPSLLLGWADSCLKALGSLFKERLERIHYGRRKMQKQWRSRLETGCN